VTTTVLPKAVLLRNTQSAVAFGQLVAGLAVAKAGRMRDNSRIACMMRMMGMMFFEKQSRDRRKRNREYKKGFAIYLENERQSTNEGSPNPVF
jgi:hypothetical protein